MCISKKVKIFLKIVKTLKSGLALHRYPWAFMNHQGKLHTDRFGFLDIFYLAVVEWEEESGCKIRERTYL